MNEEPSPETRLLAAAEAGDIGGIRAAIADGANWLRLAEKQARRNGHAEAAEYLRQHSDQRHGNPADDMAQAFEAIFSRTGPSTMLP